MSENYEVVIRGIDQKNEMLTEPCVIGTATDNHGSPCIATDVDGYIYVMYDGHNDEIKLVRSKNPGDISDWAVETSIAIKGRTLTYPVINICDDKIFVLLRSSPHGGDEGALLTLCTKSINSENWTCIDLFKGNHDKWRVNKDFKIWVNGYNRFYTNMIIHNDRILPMAYQYRTSVSRIRYLTTFFQMVQGYPQADNLNKFWNEIFAYLKDGNYPIDNNLAERSIRKLTTQRNSMLHFGSDEGVEMAATYHSVISTVKMQGRSAWEFLGKFFTNIFNGCRDYLSLSPKNIGLALCQ